MIRLFEEIGSEAFRFRTEVYICFTSRHYPTIGIRHGRRLILEEENTADLSEHVRARLRVEDTGRGTALAETVIQRSNGVFLWVTLAGQALNRNLQPGGVRLERILQNLPMHLEELFSQILLTGATDLDEVWLALQWVLFAKRRLTGEEFYFAMRSGSSSGTLPQTLSVRNVPASEGISRYVATTCKGLAEVTVSEQPHVDFIHETLRDYLLRGGGLTRLFPEVTSDQHSLSHNRLRQCCASYLQAAVTAEKNDHEHLQCSLAGTETQPLVDKYPFLQYASEFIWDHGEQGESVDFFRLLSPTTCLDVINRDRFRFGCSSAPQGLREFLTRKNCPKLLDYLSR